MTISDTVAGRLHYAWIILATGIATVFAAIGLGRFGYTMILPDMRQGLQLSYTQMGTLATGNFVGYLLFALVGGHLASRFGPRLVIAVALLFTGAMMVLTGLATGFIVALAARTLTGMGSAGSNVPVMGLLSAWFGHRRRGMASGIAVAGGGIGMLTTGWLVPQLVGRFPEAGWRISWYVLGGVAILVGVVAWVVLRNRPAAIGLRPVDDDEDQGQTAPAPVVSSSRSLYSSPLFWHLGLVYAAFGSAYSIYVTFFAAYLTEEQGLLPAEAGTLWSVVGLLAIGCGFVWGSLSDHIGRRRGLALVLTLMGLSILLLATWPTYAGYFISAVLFGGTALGVPTIMAAACGDFAGPRLAPAALGLITVLFGIGQSIGPGVGGWLADQWGTFALAFIVAAALAFVGGAGTLVLRRHTT